MAENESKRDTILERVREGVARAKAAGVKFGRPRKVFDYQLALELREKGWSYERIARKLGASATTVWRAVNGRR